MRNLILTGLAAIVLGLFACTTSRIEPTKPQKTAKSVQLVEELYNKAIKLKKLALSTRNNSQRIALAKLSLDAFLEAEEKDPDNEKGLYELADLYRRTRNFPLAIQKFDRVIDINPRNHAAYHDKASCLYLLGRYAEARQSVDKAIEIAEIPDYFITRGAAHTRLGQLLKKDSYFTKAIEDHKKAIKLNPKVPDYQVALARVYQIVSQARNDKTLLAKALKQYYAAFAIKKPFIRYNKNQIKQEKKQLMKQLGVDDF